jgi:excisionase family DNA binding protein
MIATNDMITLDAAQRLTGLSYFTLYRALKRQGIPTTKAGRTLLVRVSDLAQLKTK